MYFNSYTFLSKLINLEIQHSHAKNNTVIRARIYLTIKGHYKSNN